MEFYQDSTDMELVNVFEETLISQSENVVYTGRVHTTGDREKGTAKSNDGRLDITLAVPGSTGAGTNPEQLFAAGWSACFEGAMKIAARKMKLSFPEETSIDAAVDLCLTDGAFTIQACLNIALPGLNPKDAEALIREAHATCPYSKATRGNINAVINLV